MLWLNAISSLAVISSALGLPSQIPFKAGYASSSVKTPKEIETWALNPTGDAAVIRVKATHDENPRHELHLLAINAQYTVPSVHYGQADPSSLYTFLDDQTLLTVSPASEKDLWNLDVQTLNYTTIPPAFPPSASHPRKIGAIKSSYNFKEVIFSQQAGVLTLLDEHKQSSFVRVVKEGREWSIEGEARPLKNGGNSMEGFSSNGTHLLHSVVNKSSSSIQLLDLRDSTFNPKTITQSNDNHLSGPVFGKDDHIAWLSQLGDENRKLWLSNGLEQWEVDLNFDHSPEKIIFSKDGNAIYLLTPHQNQRSLFHIWRPKSPSLSNRNTIEPIRIPSNGTIHSAIHVGITPLDHAHLIGVKSDKNKNEGKELWVISHSAHEDPTYNYENIRLTYST